MEEMLEKFLKKSNIGVTLDGLPKAYLGQNWIKPLEEFPKELLVEVSRKTWSNT